MTDTPPWYKTAIIYEVPVRAFHDSNADGIGDFNGLTSKLDYISDLGVTALWLLPFYPSPLRDGGYDIADYTDVHPIYGTLDDFRRFLDEAHRRNLKVITELVINHTSNEHPWFQRARAAPAGSPERDFYVWSDTPKRYETARIIFKDFETSNWSWDPVARQYYWHRFYSHQPDLNFDNPAVHDAVLGLVDTWFNFGVDGLRLDAVPYLFEREGTSCENLPETHAFLKRLRKHVDTKFKDRMLLAEANQWPTDAAAYFGEGDEGDECHMNFHFPLMPRMFMALQMEDRFPIIDILRQTPAIPRGCQWATFLRNHDELTLEMVTDEERDYMYEAYTEERAARINLGIRRRLAPLMRLRSKIELLNGLLMSLPGTPVLYYGDEIGMGDNVYLGDRDGVRTPMQWSPDRSAGFSTVNPQRLHLPVVIDPEYHYEAVNVEAQESNPASLLRWMKQLIDQRKQDDIFGVGDIEFVAVDNPRVLAFVRSLGDRRVLVAANLARHPQHALLELANWAGRTPLEMFGRTSFPSITEQGYPLSFAPYQFYWFQLEQPAPTSVRPALSAQKTWTGVTAEAQPLARAVTRYAKGQRWFRGKAKTITGSRIVDILRGGPAADVLFLVVEIAFADANHTYVVPVSFAEGEAAALLEQRSPLAIIASLQVVDGERVTSGVLYDALATPEAGALLLEVARGTTSISGVAGPLICKGAEALREHLGASTTARLLDAEQTNTTVLFGDRAIMKVYRQLETGVNAETEIGEAMTQHAPAGVVPRMLASLQYRNDKGVSSAVGIVHEFVENQGTAWDLLVRELEVFLEQVLHGAAAAPDDSGADLFDLRSATLSPEWQNFGGQHLRNARLLGERTAAVHNAVAALPGPDFAHEPFTMMHQQSLYQGARALLIRNLDLLAARRDLPAEVADTVAQLRGAQGAVEELLKRVTLRPLTSLRFRAHGDLHLGQVLSTGSDFVIIDFEGEPARPMRERRYKRCPLRDVAGMVRSFAYAAESTLRAGRLRERDATLLRPWAIAWSRHMGARYLDAYSKALDPTLMPPEDDARELLRFYMAEKCVYELGYEINNRPTWLPIPVQGMLDLVGDRGAQ